MQYKYIIHPQRTFVLHLHWIMPINHYKSTLYSVFRFVNLSISYHYREKTAKTFSKKRLALVPAKCYSNNCQREQPHKGKTLRHVNIISCWVNLLTLKKNFKKKFKKELTRVKTSDIIKTTKGTESSSKGLQSSLAGWKPCIINKFPGVGKSSNKKARFRLGELK